MGYGEYLMVCICKIGENISFVVNELVKVCGVFLCVVSWVGLKDRYVVIE